MLSFGDHFGLGPREVHAPTGRPAGRRSHLKGQGRAIAVTGTPTLASLSPSGIRPEGRRTTDHAPQRCLCGLLLVDRTLKFARGCRRPITSASVKCRNHARPAMRARHLDRHHAGAVANRPATRAGDAPVLMNHQIRSAGSDPRSKCAGADHFRYRNRAVPPLCPCRRRSAYLWRVRCSQPPGDVRQFRAYTPWHTRTSAPASRCDAKGPPIDHGGYY